MTDSTEITCEPEVYYFPSEDGLLKNGVGVAPGIMELGKQLITAATEGNTNSVRELMKCGAPFATDWLGTSALHHAALGGHKDTCALLLRSGILKDAKNKVDKTPLHFAAMEGHAEVVLLLIEKGADVNSVDMLYMTPLHWAVEREHRDTINILLQNGANPLMLNKFEKSCVDIATETDREDLVELLMVGCREGEYTVTPQPCQVPFSIKIPRNVPIGNTFTISKPRSTIILTSDKETLDPKASPVKKSPDKQFSPFVILKQHVQQVDKLAMLKQHVQVDKLAILKQHVQQVDKLAMLKQPVQQVEKLATLKPPGQQHIIRFATLKQPGQQIDKLATLKQTNQVDRLVMVKQPGNRLVFKQPTQQPRLATPKQPSQPKIFRFANLNQQTQHDYDRLAAQRLLEKHGIEMLEEEDINIVASALDSGQSVVLTEAGKQALSLTEQTPVQIMRKPLVNVSDKTKRIIRVSKNDFKNQDSIGGPNILRKDKPILISSYKRHLSLMSDEKS